MRRLFKPKGIYFLFSTDRLDPFPLGFFYPSVISSAMRLSLFTVVVFFDLS